MPSRKVEDLHPTLRSLVPEWKKRCIEAGIGEPIITCTARTFREQVATFAQGREDIFYINDLRKLAAMEPISEAEAKKVVSWTMASKHITNLANSENKDDYARAFDFALVKPGGAVHWDTKADVDNDKVNDYAEAGKIAVELGLEYGGNWPTPDRAHIQLKG